WPVVSILLTRTGVRPHPADVRGSVNGSCERPGQAGQGDRVMSQRRRKAYHTAAFESLEGRELLSTAAMPLGLTGGRAALLANARAARAALLQAYRAALGGSSVIPAPGAVASGQVVPQTAASPLQPTGGISIPENHMTYGPSSLAGLAALSAGKPLS